MAITDYTTLTRQIGLMREMDIVANNIANVSTTGFRREGLMFSEYVKRLGAGQPSLSMATADVRNIDLTPGGMTATGGQFDLAIDGPGFFQVETPRGDRLTRAGSFTRNDAGELVTPDGYRLLDAGGSPIFAPPDAKTFGVGADGTVSADGTPLTRIGLYRPANPNDLNNEAGTLFRADGGVVPVDGTPIRQGFIENSNVNPVSEIARMIEVQRAYELGQSFLDSEDKRLRSAIDTLTR